jgi:hypothetical protein
MRSKWLLAMAVSAAVSVCGAAVFAQNTRTANAGQYLISAKAGGVNYVEGKVSVFRKSGTSGYLIAGDEVNVGDRITSGADGKAEILLNPGSYLRIGGNTSFDFVSTDLEDLKVNLRTGSAVFEVIAADEFRVSIKLPQTEIGLTRSGVFRVDVLADGTGRIMVFKGKAFVGPGGRTEIAGGRVATLAKGGVSVAKFDRGTNDPLDIWSKDRAREVARINSRLQRDSLRNSLLSTFNRGWNMYNSFGVWVFDPFFRRWCFLPFGYGWNSPYGWGYDYDIWRCRLPWWVINQPYFPPTSSGGGSSPGPTSTPIVSAGNRSVVPPFVRMQGGGGGMGSSRSDDIVVNSGRSRDSLPPMSSPSSSPPVSTPPIIVAPSSPPVETKGKPN